MSNISININNNNESNVQINTQNSFKEWPFVKEEILVLKGILNCNLSIKWSKLSALLKKIFNLLWIFEFETSFMNQIAKVTWCMGNLSVVYL